MSSSGEAKIYYDDLSWPEIKEAAAAGKAVVVPFGTIEQHGPHLPIATDNILVRSVCEAAVKLIPDRALLFPLIPFGFNEHHMDFPGTIAIEAETLIALLRQIGVSIARHGFERIMFVNGHGSNAPFVAQAARQTILHSGALAASCTYPSFIGELMTETRHSKCPGGMSHACEFETSLMLYVRPDLVDMSKVADDMGRVNYKYSWGDLTGRGPVEVADYWSTFSRSGVNGAPTVATRENGELWFRETAKRLAEAVVELAERERPPRRDQH